MSKKLKAILEKQGFIPIKLRFTKTNHFELKADINGVKGYFILDTGASSSCIGIDRVENFKLNIETSDVKAAGAGATEMETHISKKNIIKIGRWKKKKVTLVLFNLVHVNTALINHDAKPVDGIIGADILKKAEAVIDYKKKYLYLKR